MTRDPRTFYEYLLRQKVITNRAVKAAGLRVKETAGDYDAKQELISKKKDFYLVVDILRTYRKFRSLGKED